MIMKTIIQKFKSENEIQVHFISQKFPAVYAKLDVEALEPYDLKILLSLGTYIFMPPISETTRAIATIP